MSKICSNTGNSDEPTALGRLKVHHYAEVWTLEIHLSPNSFYGYRLEIGYFMLV